MKFTCEKKILIDAVTNVSKAITERAPFPALAGMKMTLNKEDLELTGYNMEIGIKNDIKQYNISSYMVSVLLMQGFFQICCVRCLRILLWSRFRRITR